MAKRVQKSKKEVQKGKNKINKIKEKSNITKKQILQLQRQIKEYEKEARQIEVETGTIFDVTSTKIVDKILKYMKNKGYVIKDDSNDKIDGIAVYFSGKIVDKMVEIGILSQNENSTDIVQEINENNNNINDNDNIIDNNDIDIDKENDSIEIPGNLKINW